MSSLNRKRSPKLRYWKAKLDPLLRPAFWLSGTALFLSVLLVWKYHSDSEWKTAFLQLLNSFPISESTTEEVSAQGNQDELTETIEELELGTEIDNSFLFLRDLNSHSAKKRATVNQEPEINIPDTEGVLRQTSPQLPSLADNPPRLANEGASTKLLEASGLGIFSDNFSFNSGLSSDLQDSTTNSRSRPFSIDNNQGSSIYYRFNQSNSNQTSLPTHPLQKSLNRLATANESSKTDGEEGEAKSSSSSVQAQVNSQPNPVLGNGYSVPTTSSIPNQNSFTYLNQPQYQYNNNNNLPLGVPVVPDQPGTFTPIPVPGTIIPQGSGSNSVGNNQFSNQINNANVPRLITNPGFNRNFRSPALQPFPTNQPINNSPRRIPGRFIGGGEINTFSNP